MSHNDWDVVVPGDHLAFGDIPQEIRDVKSSAKIVLNKEHQTPGTDNAGGEHVKGAARVYLESGFPTTDPEGNNLETSTSTMVDDGRLAVDTANSNELKVYVGTAAGISTGWQAVRVARVKLSENLLANSQKLVGLGDATANGQAVRFEQIDTTALTGQIKLIEPSTSGKFGVAVLDPPTDDAHLAAKKYVDAEVAAVEHTGDHPVTVDSESNAFLVAHAYKAQTAGFVTAYSVYPNGGSLYVDDTADPAGAGVLMGSWSQAVGGGYNGASVFVAKDHYFEATGTATMTWTPLIAGGAAPIDQD